MHLSFSYLELWSPTGTVLINACICWRLFGVCKVDATLGWRCFIHIIASDEIPTYPPPPAVIWCKVESSVTFHFVSQWQIGNLIKVNKIVLWADWKIYRDFQLGRVEPFIITILIYGRTHIGFFSSFSL